MQTITKNYKKLRLAESMHTRLQNKWHYAKLVKSPRFTEGGVYAWEVGTVEDRLEFLRRELRAERISMDGLVELQSLAFHIKPGDVELAEPAGIPEEEFAKRQMVVKVLAGEWQGQTGWSDGERSDHNWLIVTVPRIGPWVNPPDMEQDIKIALADGEFEVVN